MLECDVGQTEFTPPGCVSLHYVTHPLLGKIFTNIFPQQFIQKETIIVGSNGYQRKRIFSQKFFLLGVDP